MGQSQFFSPKKGSSVIDFSHFLPVSLNLFVRSFVLFVLFCLFLCLSANLKLSTFILKRKHSSIRQLRLQLRSPNIALGRMSRRPGQRMEGLLRVSRHFCSSSLRDLLAAGYLLPHLRELKVG